MCFGFDGDRALERSLALKGARRRHILGGAAAVAAAAGVAVGGGAGAAQAAGKKKGKGKGQGKRPGSLPTKKISIQLYTLRAAMNGEPGVDVVLERLAQYGYHRVELAGLYGRTPTQFKRQLSALGIRATSSHDGLSADRAALNTKLENAAILGQKFINVPYLASESLSDWQGWADQMNNEAQRAKRYGLAYGYHNHAHEFTTDLGGGTTPWDVLTDRLDPKLVHLEADLYWVYTGGVNSGAANPLKFTHDVIRSAPQKVRQYHVKDRNAETGNPADLGTGVIDFGAIFKRHAVEEYIVENDNPDVTPLTTAAVGRCYLDHLVF